MKANRISYTVILLMALVFVYYYGGKVPYMLLYTVLALPVVSFLYIAFGYFGLKYKQSLDKNSVEKGEKVKYTLTVLNKGVFFVPYLSIEFYDSMDNQDKKSMTKGVFIPPFSKRKFKFEHVYKYRGRFEIGIKNIEIRDFLGIFKLKYLNKKSILVSVYPRIINIEKFHISSNMLSDNSSSHGSMYEDTSVVDEINKYKYGDSLNRVHWKFTAKMNEMMVKKFEGTEARNLMFIFDLKKNSHKEEINYLVEDKQIEAAIGVLKYLIYNGTDVRFSYYDKEICNLECRSPVDFENIYRFLARVEFNQKINFEDIIDLLIKEDLSKQNIIISTSNMNYELYETLYRAKMAGHNISLIYISTEELEDEKDDVNGILKGLKELGINLYYINITRDVKAVLEHGGDKGNERF